MKERLHIWWDAARPKTLWAGVAPVVIGTAMAYAEGLAHAPAALAALLGAVLIQVGTNYFNDYADFIRGTDTAERDGPRRATQSGLVAPRTMRNAALATYGLAVLVSLYLVARAGWPVWVIGIASIGSGILYTAGRYALAYTGLADLFVLVFFGPVAVAGTYYVQALRIDGTVLLAGLAPGLLSVAVLVVNNLRDIESDRRAGRRTLAVRFGRGFARTEYLLCIVGASLVPPALILREAWYHFAFAASLTLLAAIPVMRVVLTRTDGAALNPALAGTARLLLLYSLLFSIGWCLNP